ncbi:MAG: NAD(P)H-hydrate epimerase [Mariprofundaceae bacterium]
MFWTMDGVSVPSLTRTQMQEVDRIAMEKGIPSLNVMMKNAGRIMANFVHTHWPRMTKLGPVMVLAGAGHNGGGGICAARYLLAIGIDVRVLLSHPQDMLAIATREQLFHFVKAGGVIAYADEINKIKPRLIIDALIGYGLHGSPKGAAVTLIRWANKQGVPVVSLDVPSGLDISKGSAPGEVIQATTTLTLALPKRGMHVPFVGKLWLADIGIETPVYEHMGVRFDSPFAGEDSIRLETSPASRHQG